MVAEGAETTIGKGELGIDGGLGAALALALLLLPTPAHADDLVATRTNSLAIGDFDGDGLTDYAYGFPKWDFSKGKVTIVYGDERIQVWSRDSPGIWDDDVNYNYFGDSIAVGDFDQDGYDDLAVGVPGDDHEASNAGSIHILYSDSTGITDDDQIIDQDSSGIADVAESADYYGEFLYAGDFNCDGSVDLAVGIPLENLIGPNESILYDAGAVNVINGTGSGLSTVDDWFVQGYEGIDGTPKRSEHFGASLVTGNFNGDIVPFVGPCGDLVIGVPEEEITLFSTMQDAGAIHAFFGSTWPGLDKGGDERINQNSWQVDEAVQANDWFSSRMYRADYIVDGYDDIVVRVDDTCGLPAGAQGYHFFAGSAEGFMPAQDEVQCVYVDSAIQEIVDAYEACILEPGVCHCAEEFAFAIEHDTTIPAPAQIPWMCEEKSKVATTHCALVTEQNGPTASAQNNVCIEASREMWQDCPGFAMEQG